MAQPTEMLRVRNWDRFQHYKKDRTPPWIKLHYDLLSSETWVSLDDASRVLAIACMLIASRNNGCVPNKPAYVQRVAYLNAPPDFEPLISIGFLEKTLADDSESLANDSTLQADATALQADACLDTDVDTDRDTEGEKDRGADAQPEYAFIGHVIRLKADDLTRWRESYHLIPDIIAELRAADAYYAENPPKDGKWFFPVSNWLKNAHGRVAEKVQAEKAAEDEIYRNVL